MYFGNIRAPLVAYYATVASTIYQSVDGRKRIKMKTMTENIAGTCVCSKCAYVIKSNFVPIERVNVDSRKRIKEGPYENRTATATRASKKQWV